MKENVKIGLLGIIALASVANVFMLSNISNQQEELTETLANNQNQANAYSNVPQPPVNPVNQPQPPIEAPAPQPPIDMKKTSVKWANMVHDFGKVKQNSTNKYAFEFTNTGSEPLLITDAKGSCGCTVPEYPKEPIAPGQKATINVEYKPGVQENQQEKTVTVTANTEPMQTVLKIRAFVEKEK